MHMIHSSSNPYTNQRVLCASTGSTRIEPATTLMQGKVHLLCIISHDNHGTWQQLALRQYSAGAADAQTWQGQHLKMWMGHSMKDRPGGG